MRRFEGSDQLLEQAHKRAVFVGWQCRSYELPHVVDQGDQCSMLMLALLSESQEFGGLLDPIPLVQTDYDIVEHRSRVERRERAVSYTHLRAHETPEHLVCRLLLEKKKTHNKEEQHIKIILIKKIKKSKKKTAL